MKTIAEMEIERVQWHSLRDASGVAGNVPIALRRLLNSETPEIATEAYWLLENHVVVQGQLFQVAEHVVPVLIAAFLDVRPKHVRLGVLELLFQILSGGPHEQEVALGNERVVSACKDQARLGLWILYKELVGGEQDAAREVLELIEPDMDRLSAFLLTS